MLYYGHVKVMDSIFSNNSICPPDTSRYQDLSFHGISAGKYIFDETIIIWTGCMPLQIQFAIWNKFCYNELRRCASRSSFFWRKLVTAYNKVDITGFSLWHIILPVRKRRKWMSKSKRRTVVKNSGNRRAAPGKPSIAWQNKDVTSNILEITLRGSPLLSMDWNSRRSRKCSPQTFPPLKPMNCG